MKKYRNTIYFFKRDLEKEIDYLKSQKLNDEFWIGHINGLKNSLDRLNKEIDYTKKLGKY